MALLARKILCCKQFCSVVIQNERFSSVKIHKDDNPKKILNADPTEVKCPENIIRKKRKTNGP